MALKVSTSVYLSNKKNPFSLVLLLLIEPLTYYEVGCVLLEHFVFIGSFELQYINRNEKFTAQTPQHPNLFNLCLCNLLHGHFLWQINYYYYYYSFFSSFFVCSCVFCSFANLKCVSR